MFGLTLRILPQLLFVSVVSPTPLYLSVGSSPARRSVRGLLPSLPPFFSSSRLSLPSRVGVNPHPPVPSFFVRGDGQLGIRFLLAKSGPPLLHKKPTPPFLGLLSAPRLLPNSIVRKRRLPLYYAMQRFPPRRLSSLAVRIGTVLRWDPPSWSSPEWSEVSAEGVVGFLFSRPPSPPRREVTFCVCGWGGGFLGFFFFLGLVCRLGGWCVFWGGGLGGGVVGWCGLLFSFSSYHCFFWGGGGEGFFGGVGGAGGGGGAVGFWGLVGGWGGGGGCWRGVGGVWVLFFLFLWRFLFVCAFAVRNGYSLSDDLSPGLSSPTSDQSHPAIIWRTPWPTDTSPRGREGIENIVSLLPFTTFFLPSLRVIVVVTSPASVCKKTPQWRPLFLLSPLYSHPERSPFWDVDTKWRCRVSSDTAAATC